MRQGVLTPKKDIDISPFSVDYVNIYESVYPKLLEKNPYALKRYQAIKEIY